MFTLQFGQLRYDILWLTDQQIVK